MKWTEGQKQARREMTEPPAQPQRVLSVWKRDDKSGAGAVCREMEQAVNAAAFRPLAQHERGESVT